MSKDDGISKYASYLSLGLEIAVGISFPIFLGYWLDGYFELSPWLLLAGCVVGMVNVFLIIFKLDKQFEDK
ncbi:MAG: AtpZ/AtpI family protein [Balneolaceae bacterium]|nr:AtpZ/AtpI family protein [Balneolaceae bacterium]